MKEGISIFWFRRDLRLNDNAGLYHALKENNKVLPVFIFDTDILSLLEKADRRVDFIYQVIRNLKEELITVGSDIRVFHGKPLNIFKEITHLYDVKNVYANHDYEPYARKRDSEIQRFLEDKGILFCTYKDQCIFEKREVVKSDGAPYTVFTPYSRRWKSLLTTSDYNTYPSEKYFSGLLKIRSQKLISIDDLGFKKTAILFDPKIKINEHLLARYAETRDVPAINGTSRLSTHLRFGTLSIRQLVEEAYSLSETFLNELIWRDFYMMILWHFPHVEKNSFKKEYDHIRWKNNEKEFNLWCQGKTGFPIVDAGMRELNATGFMHNRVRMIVSSFLVKDLLIDWRWGEAYFAQQLDDYDLSANNGGWQWAAGSGCDAAPYFRIFNPLSQQQKFDPDFKYIKKWVPEFETEEYPAPIVDHKQARLRALKVYKEALADRKQTKMF